MSVGLVGYGTLGQALASRLTLQGHTLEVFDPLGQAGEKDRLEAVVSPEALLERSTSIIVLALEDQEQLEALLEGQTGLLAANLEGRLVVDCSSPPAELALARSRRVQRAGGRYLGAWPQASGGGASSGHLALEVYGERADWEDGSPLVEALATQCHYGGSLESIKSANTGS